MTDFEKYLDIKFMIILPLGAESFYKRKDDRHTGISKLIVGFRNFDNAPNKLELLERVGGTDS